MDAIWSAPSPAITIPQEVEAASDHEEGKSCDDTQVLVDAWCSDLLKATRTMPNIHAMLIRYGRQRHFTVAQRDSVRLAVHNLATVLQELMGKDAALGPNSASVGKGSKYEPAQDNMHP